MAIAKRLWRAGLRRASIRACLRAVLIGRCSDWNNLWVAEIEDAAGHSFEALGRKMCCGSRMCAGGLKLLQRKSERRLVEARDAFWKNHAREAGKYERFVTLTGPTIQGFSLEDDTKMLNRAFELLTDRSFWVTRVEAGAKHLEFTVTSRGYHAHIHVLCYGSYIERDEGEEAKTLQWRAARVQRQSSHDLRQVNAQLPPLGNLQDEWTSCLTQAAREFGRVIEWSAPEINQGWYSLLHSTGELTEVQPTTAAKANVHVCLVREKGRPSDGEKSLHSAVKELTKYLTKSSSWWDVSDEQLVEIAEVRRWPRCFELLGKWRASRRAEVKQSELVPARIVVQMRTDETWEDFCRRVERENADPASYVIAWDTLQARDAPIDAATLYDATSGAIASLDTDFVSRSAPEPEDSPPLRKWFIRPRAPSLMELGEAMDFDEWLKIVSVRLARSRQVRAVQLCAKYPKGRFYCLDGTNFGRGKSKRVDPIADLRAIA